MQSQDTFDRLSSCMRCRKIKIKICNAMTYVIFFTIQFNQDCFSSHFVKNLAIHGKKKRNEEWNVCTLYLKESKASIEFKHDTANTPHVAWLRPTKLCE